MSRLHTRRGFVETVTAVAAVSVTRARGDSPSAGGSEGPRKVGGETIIGAGEHTYRVRHHFPQLPDRFTWQTTHGVAVDAAGNLYVIHEGRADQKDHPAIFVFDPAGQFIRAFGSQFQGGGHGIEIRREGGEEFLYVCGYQGVKSFAKLTPTGEVVWYRKAPMESGAYAEGEDLSTKPNWSRKGFLPTNFAFLDDGGFLLVDGYGAFVVHQFDANARWVKSFGGEGKGEGTFNTPHGIWIDRRAAVDGTARPPRIVVADRAHHTLQFFSLDGRYLETVTGFGLPANIDTAGSLMLVPELKACVTLLGPDDKPVARLGRAVERLDQIKNLRGQPEAWIDGEFVHPHDACFAADGAIYVAEWVATGRITRLERV